MVRSFAVVALAELLAHEVDEVGGVGGVDARPLDEERRLRAPPPSRPVDEARVLHGPDDLVPPLGRALLVAERVVGVRRLDHPRDERRLGQGQVGDVLAEVDARRLAHAVDPERARLAEVDLVQVELEDLLLAGPPLEHEGEQRLLRLPPVAALGRPVAALVDVGQEEVLAELLRDRAAAVGDRAVASAGCGGRRPGARIGSRPGVAEEAAVLDREHRLHQVVGQLLEAHAAPLLAVLVEEVGDELGLEGLLRVALLRAAARMSLTRVDALLVGGEGDERAAPRPRPDRAREEADARRRRRRTARPRPATPRARRSAGRSAPSRGRRAPSTRPGRSTSGRA